VVGLGPPWVRIPPSPQSVKFSTKSIGFRQSHTGSRSVDEGTKYYARRGSHAINRSAAAGRTLA
ncbi:MAG: hypothetical protein ACK2UM_02025, partial [Anaerolineales bacterium]